MKSFFLFMATIEENIPLAYYNPERSGSFGGSGQGNQQRQIKLHMPGTDLRSKV